MRPRIGPDKDHARQMAAQINSQLESHTHSVFNFEPVQIDELQTRWLNHHEQVLRSSLQTIRRYRAATTHLINFVREKGVASKTFQFQARHAEEFVHYLRTIKVAPNGHENSQKRPLLDKGIKYILQCCRSMFGYAIKRRHLSPYAEKPFSCLDLKTGMLYVRNKPHLGWQVKTRNERKILLIDELRDVLKISVGDRLTGPVFLKRRYSSASAPPELHGQTEKQLEDLLQLRVAQEEADSGNVRYPVEMFPYCDQLARLMNTFHTLRSIGSLPVWCRMQLTPATTLHYDYREKISSEQSASAPVYMPWSLILILLVIKPFDFVYRTFRRLVKRTR